MAADDGKPPPHGLAFSGHGDELLISEPVGQNEQQSSQLGEDQNCLPHKVPGCHYDKLKERETGREREHPDQRVETDKSSPKGGGQNNTKVNEQLTWYFQLYLW